MVSNEGDLQAKLAAPQITQVALHRLCDYEGAAPQEVFGCVCDVGS